MILMSKMSSHNAESSFKLFPLHNPKKTVSWLTNRLQCLIDHLMSAQPNMRIIQNLPSICQVRYG